MSAQKEFCVLCLFAIGVCADINFTEHNNKNATQFLNEIVKSNDAVQRMTHPLEETVITQQIVPTSANSSVYHQQKNNSSVGNFKPSPQIGTYYEYNSFPVLPALPEAKHFSAVNFNDKPMQAEIRPWMDKPTVLKLPSRQPSWNNKISFPTTQSSYLPIGNKPYPYAIDDTFKETATNRNQYSYASGTGYSDVGFKFQHPYASGTGHGDVGSKLQYPYTMTEVSYETTTSNSNYDNQLSYSQFGSMTGYESTTANPNYNSFMSYTRFGVTPSSHSGSDNDNKYGDIFNQKENFYGSSTGMEVSNSGENPYVQKTHYEHPHAMVPFSGHMLSPLKKVLKFLAAIIPFGILLSALTPTIINVSPMNTTQIRGRALNTDMSRKRLMYSLNHINKLNEAGCEERVICELLLGDQSSKNSKKYAKELISNFKKEDSLEQLEELKVIFEAVEMGSCNSLNCTNTDENNELNEDETVSLEES
ncbi:hypothetical protein RN001_002367 [Aquatica leii]|uniref:Uncharacterized protein n=1 Tax=Aquatica leii TaxID=1421715 RepID=A0AAN7SD88_9COLE|nr:hypothetical protein RN001_002367 [Aquatica leii]